jgi:CDP-diacylglycerol--serine O-phosphatidyltransferase
MLKILKMISIADVVTLLNGLIGFLAIMYVIDGVIENAYPLILFAVILDGIDGMVARFFKSKHTMGKYLDSIADMVSFCFAPAVLVYAIFYLPEHTSFTHWQNTLTVLAAFFVLGLGILRLGRFAYSGYKERDFIGLPTPAMALFIIMVTLPSFELEAYPIIVLPLITFTSVLMVSDIKYPKLPNKFRTVFGLPVFLVILSFIVEYPLYRIVQIITFTCILIYILAGPFIGEKFNGPNKPGRKSVKKLEH